MTYRAGPGTPNAQNYREYAPASAPWIWRDGAVLLTFEGQIVMLGGWNTDSGSFGASHPVTNEIWGFDGTTWTQLLANDPTATDRWSPRHTAPTFVHNGAIYVVGSDVYNGAGDPAGGHGGGTSDVWRGSDPVTWELRTNSAAWGPRVFHVAASYQNKLWCGLGQTSRSASTALKDWWGSSDNGATWQRYADFPGAARGLISDPFEFNGELIVISGGTFDDDPSLETYYNDIFAWNGSTWRTVLANGVAPFSGRIYHRTLVFAGAAYVINGFNATGNIIPPDSFWWSDNLVDWQRRPTLFPNSHADGICVFNGDLWMGPGNHGQQNAWRVQVF